MTKKNSIHINSKVSDVYWLNSIQKKRISNYFGERIIDYLLNFPINIFDKNVLTDLLSQEYISKIVTVDVKVKNIKDSYNKRLPINILCENRNNQKINIVFFNISRKFIYSQFKIGKIYRITGKLSYFSPFFQIIHPNSYYQEEEIEGSFEEIEPLYNLKRSTIPKNFYRKLIIKTYKYMSLLSPQDWILKDVIKKNNWHSFENSLKNIHFPAESDLSKLEIFRQRLAFDEILANIIMVRNLKKKTRKNRFLVSSTTLSKKIIDQLSFKLTDDQKNCLKDINNDLKKKKMFRLLQGDVGSGKTIVALLSIAEVINSGYQAVLMAPSEILVKQHFKYFSKILKPYNIKVNFLTSKISSKDKNNIYYDLKKKKIDLLIGTHSLLNENINFNELGLTVIDEQHKFGVNQRLRLQKKSIESHILVLSATPIPRSLTFVIYGEIDVSLIKNKPKGRKLTKTTIIGQDRISNIVEGIKRVIKKKEKVFWVLPRIGNEEETELENETSVVKRFNYLKKYFQDKVAFVHGKMKKEEVESIFFKFNEEKIMILVTTTIIEVGIDIPKATTIIIEEANRFGLAQLHQLRGRVGRNNIESNCVLVHTKNISENGKARLNVMKESNDGFYISEQDLKIRGGGEVFGVRQTGLPTWRFFHPFKDLNLISDVKENVEYIKDKEELVQLLTSLFFNNKKIDNYFTG